MLAGNRERGERESAEMPTLTPPAPGFHRSVETPDKREVDLYVRTYTTLLQSSGAIGVASLEPAHLNSASSLHAGALEPEPDLNAFIYSIQRLPACIVDVAHIILGQSIQAFHRAGYHHLSTWKAQTSPGRRRKWHFDGVDVLAAYIASSSDLDDLIPSIVAYQIEWNKIHRIIEADAVLAALIAAAAADPAVVPTGEALAETGARLLLAPADWARLQSVWGAALWNNLAKIAADRKRVTLRMLGGSYLGYVRATRHWWTPVGQVLAAHDLRDRPVYFVSSNTHSLVNVISGVTVRRKNELVDYIRETRNPELLPELEKLEAGDTRSPWENLLYFAARPYFADPRVNGRRKARVREEEERGIHHIEPRGAIDVGVQVIDLARLDLGSFDPRLTAAGETINPAATDAIIVNINYPLGFSAYHLMSQVATVTDRLMGIYILGKAATLNGRIGDVMLANSVFDEHSGNTYWFENCFGYEDLAPYLAYGAALDNQKAVTVKGTYLQNQGYLDFYYRENYTVVEMEAGPYLDAIFEDLSLERHPTNEAVNLAQVQERIDLGIIHYASDTPYTRAQTLGARGMSFHGMDSTYASTIAILRRVFMKSGVIAATGTSAKT
jgi:hypothetical protein